METAVTRPLADAVTAMSAVVDTTMLTSCLAALSCEPTLTVVGCLERKAAASLEPAVGIRITAAITGTSQIATSGTTKTAELQKPLVTGWA
jgi:hypothetical protein